MLPPLGLSLTSVALRLERLFCLEVFSHLPPCMPATEEMISSSSSIREEASSEALGGERLLAFQRRRCLMSEMKFLQIRH